MDKKLRADSGMRQVTYEVKKEILNIVREFPEYGTKRIMAELESRGMTDIDQRGLYEELVRMRLNTKKHRLEYIERTGTLLPEMKNELDRELLKDKERKVKTEKIDRDHYLEQIKRSIGDRNKEKQAREHDIIDKFKGLEPLLGDADLYGEISSELAKLGGGKDIAELFEKMILKMAESKIESASIEADSDEPKDLTDEDISSGTIESSDEPESQFSESEKNLAPIDVGKNAFETEDEDDKDEKKREIDWENYSKKLESKFNKE